MIAKISFISICLDRKIMLIIEYMNTENDSRLKFQFSNNLCFFIRPLLLAAECPFVSVVPTFSIKQHELVGRYHIEVRNLH